MYGFIGDTVLYGKSYFCYMALKSIRIENFKSIGEIEIKDPQPFSVLVGPNAAGKSNIFAALQFLHHLSNTFYTDVISGFGGSNFILNQARATSQIHLRETFSNFRHKFSYDFDEKPIAWKAEGSFTTSGREVTKENDSKGILDDEDYLKFIKGFSRIFIKKREIVFQVINDDSKLAPDASNLEQVLKRILNDDEIKGEFIETLQLFIPGLDKVEVVSSEFSSRLDLLVYEKHLPRPINKELISDGTYNIIAILTALYQSKTPQFLCIEEPENGLNPQVVKELVEICRYLCERHGHYIWLNTHSQSLVSQLKPEEIILVDKIDGFTQIKQFEKGSFGDMPMDEAWLTNTLGGGLPW